MKINFRKLILWYSIIMVILILILLINALYTHCLIWAIFSIWVWLSTLFGLINSEKEREEERKKKILMKGVKNETN